MNYLKLAHDFRHTDCICLCRVCQSVYLKMTKKKKKWKKSYSNVSGNILNIIYNNIRNRRNDKYTNMSSCCVRRSLVAVVVVSRWQSARQAIKCHSKHICILLLLFSIYKITNKNASSALVQE